MPRPIRHQTLVEDTMSISTLASTQNSTMGLIQGTGTAQTQSVNTVLAQSQDPSLDQSQSKLSGGAQSMSQLQQMATSNPTQFKAATQKIASDLDAAAKKETDPTKAKFLETLSSKFADASKSGNMSSLQLNHGAKHPHSGTFSAAGKYGGQNNQNSGMFSEVGSIVSNALSSVGSTSSTSTTAAASTTAASGTDAEMA